MKIEIPRELIEEASKNEIKKQVEEYFEDFETEDRIEEYCISYAEKALKSKDGKKIEKAITNSIGNWVEDFMSNSNLSYGEIIKYAIIEKISKLSIEELLVFLKKEDKNV